MPTHVFTKKKLIELIKRDFTDNDIFLLTTEISEFVYAKKIGCNKVTYAFGEDAFKEKGGVGVLARNPSFAIGVFQEADISDRANKLFKKELLKSQQ